MDPRSQDTWAYGTRPRRKRSGGRAVRTAAATVALALLIGQAGFAFAATITTDMWIYQDGDTVTVTGVEFGANEVVDFVTTDPVGVVVDTGSASTDEIGGVTYAFVLNVTEPGIYTVVGAGQTSGLSASTEFDPPSTIVITFPTATTYSAATWNAGCSTVGGDMCGTAQTGQGNLTKIEYSLRQGSGNYWSGSAFSSATEVKTTLFSGSTTSSQAWSITPFPASNFPADGSYTLAVYTTQSGNPTANSLSRTFTIDTTGPAPTVAPKSGQASPTNGLPIEFDVDFNESIQADSQFTTSDLTLGGSANTTGASLTLTERTGSANDKYRVAVSGVTGTGTVTLSVNASAVTDALGNSSSASGTASVTYDGDRPSVTVNKASGQADPTTSLPIKFTVEFSEAMQNDIVAADVVLGGTATHTSAVVTVTELAPNNNTRYEVSVANLTSFGTLTASIPANARKDLVGNFNTASTSTDNEVGYIPADSDGPVITIGTTAVAVGGWYNIASSGTDGIDVYVSATDTSGVASFTCSVDAGTPQVYGPTGDVIHLGDGEHTVACDAEDTYSNTSSDSADFDVDQTAPSISLDAGANSCTVPGNPGWCRGTQTAGFSASDATSGVAAPPCTTAGVSPCAFTKTSATNGSAVQIASGSVSDVAGNTASSIDAGPFMIDSVAPNVAFSNCPTIVVLGSSGTVAWSASDSTSGIPVADQSGTVPLDTAGPGPNTVTKTAYDVAGNSATASCTYSIGQVIFDAPIDGPSVINNAKQGRVIPVKARVIVDGVAVTTGYVSISVNGLTVCPSGSQDTLETYASPGNSFVGNQFAYDPVAGRWRYNLDTSAFGMVAPKCYVGNVYVGGTADGSGRVTGGGLVGYFLIKLSK